MLGPPGPPQLLVTLVKQLPPAASPGLSWLQAVASTATSAVRFLHGVPRYVPTGDVTTGVEGQGQRSRKAPPEF